MSDELRIAIEAAKAGAKKAMEQQDLMAMSGHWKAAVRL